MKTGSLSLLALGALVSIGAGPLLAQTAISADGAIESIAGGFKFPDGSVQQAAARQPSNIVVVAKSGAPFSSIQAALDSILDATASNPYVVYVAPGIYSERVEMKPHVDVQGAGTHVVQITSPASGFATPTLETAAHAELRSLTVRSTAAPGFDSVPIACRSKGALRDVAVEASADGGSGLVRARGIYAFPCTELVLRNVAVTSSGASGLNSGMSIGGLSSQPPPMLYVVDSEFAVFGTGGNNASGISARGLVTISGTSISVQGAPNGNTGFHLNVLADSPAPSQVELRGVTISAGAASAASGIGVWGQDQDGDTATILIDRSSISSPDDSIRTSPGMSVFVGASRLGGTVTTFYGGSVRCVSSYDGSFTALDSSCAVPSP